MTAPERDETCELEADGVPTCANGPLARLTWTLRQLAEIAHLRRSTPDAR